MLKSLVFGSGLSGLSGSAWRSAPRLAAVAQLELRFDSQDTALLVMLQVSLSACVLSMEELQFVSCAEGPEASSFQLLWLTGFGYLVFFISAGELLVSSLYVSPFQVSWAVSRSLGGGVTGLTPDPLRRLAWAERLVNGDFGLQLVDGDGSRLAVGSLNAKEPQLDLLLALPGDLQAQLPSGALLALDARALRLGLRQGNDLHFGPPLDGGLFALSAKIQGLHTEAILVTDAALQLVADYSCQLPPAEYYAPCKQYEVKLSQMNQLLAVACKLTVDV
ncbi:unnamed protein product [Effrenium voratum]|uniref:Uncharacterized protein n=1 Tax=Effrenium voratum TaxID=2562239 RepID=A0AA36I9N3_9DINO|nr:unnamed protein product [Effrenium voratum]